MLVFIMASFQFVSFRVLLSSSHLKREDLTCFKVIDFARSNARKDSSDNVKSSTNAFFSRLGQLAGHASDRAASRILLDRAVCVEDHSSSALLSVSTLPSSS
jgi:hypothetical protein